MEEEKTYTINGLTKDAAQTIIGNYLQLALKRSGGSKITETVSVWFPIDNFLAFARELTDEIDQGGPNIPSGVRVYFANYGTNGNPHDPKYANQNTVVLINTKEVKVTAQNGTETTVHRDYYVPPKKDGSNFVPPPMNAGNLCPPETGCDCDNILLGVFCAEPSK